MSALSNRAPLAAIQVDGIRRYHTRIKAIVHSHQSLAPVYLSDDVVSCQLGKTISGVGRANLALTASKNYTNLLYPNDVLNIYFNRGDGQGWVRTHFGYLDRIEEEYTVDDSGMPSTVYHVISSDWQKVIEKTEIYFNPHLAGRRDIAGTDFDTINIGGLSMQMRGLSLTGSPADMVVNLLLLQLGFGSQWILPESYQARVDPRFVNLKKEYATGTLLRSLKDRLSPAQREKLEQLISTGELDRLRVDAASSGANTNAAREAFAEDVVTLLGGNNTGTGGRRGDQLSPNLFEAYYDQASPGSERGNSTLLDIVNLFDFVEFRAIDGFGFESSIWERQGPLSTIIKSVSNESINEIIYDLRPMTPGGIAEGTNWDRTPDELGGNVGNGTEPDGVRYVPSIIMREFPFGTVNYVDASAVDTGLRVGGNPANFGKLYFGAIFSNKPNDPGRHLVDGPLLSVLERQDPGSDKKKSTKHLDVAVISETEIIQSRLGRSDNDHFNLFDMVTEETMGSSHKFVLKDFLPIITPIHIMRHGLRVREVTSRFARFGFSTAVAPTAPQSSQPAESVVDDTGEFSPIVIPPVAAPPAGYTLRFTNSYGSNYGYRRDRGGRGNTFWHFHNGIDIGVNPRVDGVVNIVAIADGYIVASIPTGTTGFGGYGEYVVVEHPQFESGGVKVFSVYAHLHTRDPRTGNPSGSTRHVDAIAQGYHPRTAQRSNFQKRRVNRGDILGTMGKTGVMESGTHLHFEIASKFPVKSTTTLDIPTSDANRTVRIAQLAAAGYSNPEQWVSTTIAPADGPIPPTPVSDKSSDPVQFFSNNGVNLVSAIRDLNDGVEEAEETDGEEGGGEDPVTPEQDAPAAATTPVETDQQEVASGTPDAVLTGFVDGVEARRQLGRWALLQDHWYQHNLEYLSGQVVMRGAPEIRVGMRLDILERDMSFYVEGVNHSWSYPDKMVTTLQVTRGQANNPYPAYALPPTPGFNTQQTARRSTSRLAQYAIVPDPIAVRRAIVLRENRPENVNQADGRGIASELDVEANWGFGLYDFGELPGGLLPAEEITTTVDFVDAEGLEALLARLDSVETVETEDQTVNTANGPSNTVLSDE